jgi:hypothetical protein
MAAKSVRQVTLDFCKKKTTRNCPALLLSRHFSFRQRLAGKLTRPVKCGKLNVCTARFFALRVSLVRMQPARLKIVRTVRILPAIEKIGKREKWTRSSFEISASSRTSITASPRWRTACWK